VFRANSGRREAYTGGSRCHAAQCVRQRPARCSQICMVVHPRLKSGTGDSPVRVIVSPQSASLAGAWRGKPTNAGCQWARRQAKPRPSAASAGLNELISRVSLSCIIWGRSGSEGQSQIVRASSPRFDQATSQRRLTRCWSWVLPSCWSRPSRGSLANGVDPNRPVRWTPY
jgi:hypothetical protein